MTNKERFFKTTLVPLGQVAELITLVTHVGALPSLRADFGNSFMDALNLTSVYAIHPAVDELTRLEGRLNEIERQFLGILEKMDSQCPQALRKLLQAPQGVRQSYSSREQTAFREAARRIAELLPAVQFIHEELGFSQTLRQEWLARMVAAQTPLTRAGRINRWRTFVLNGSWAQTAEKLHLLPSMAENHFSTESARLRAKSFWTEVFAADDRATATAAGQRRLPKDVVVTSLPNGLLTVRTEHQPKLHLNAKSLGLLKKHATGVPAHIQEALQRQDWSKACDLEELPDTLAAAAAWQTAWLAAVPRLNASMEAWERALAHEDILRKLKSQFTAAERELIAEVLKTHAHELLPHPAA